MHAHELTPEHLGRDIRLAGNGGMHIGQLTGLERKRRPGLIPRPDYLELVVSGHGLLEAELDEAITVLDEE